MWIPACLVVAATVQHSGGRRGLREAALGGDRMVEYSNRVIVGSPPWIKPQESDWNNPRNTQPDAEACRQQCLSIPACGFGTYITGGERKGECWLAGDNPGEDGVEEKKCGVPCDSFRRIRTNGGPGAASEYDIKAQYGAVLQAGHALSAAKPSPWSRLMIDAQVNWKGGLSSFSASTPVLHAIRQGIAAAVRIPMAHIAQVELTEWDERLVIEYHLKVHENEKALVERTLTAPGFGATIFDNIVLHHQKMLGDSTIRAALSTLKISGVKHGGQIAAPDDSPGIELLISVLAVVAFIGAFHCMVGKSEAQVVSHSIGMEKRNRSMAEYPDDTPVSIP
eukprot:g1532.t1